MAGAGRSGRCLARPRTDPPPGPRTGAGGLQRATVLSVTRPEDLQSACMLCDPHLADDHFQRVRLWGDDLWRLSAVLQGPIAGFAHLEPRRHIPCISDLDGQEAITLGPVLAAATAALCEAAEAEKTYVYVFGDHVPHLHFNLAPHRLGDALVGGPGLLAADALDADRQAHERVAALTRQRLAQFHADT
jgi:diadenosine tetraphosphate (Ap4A) HIT family hydrolase